MIFPIIALYYVKNYKFEKAYIYLAILLLTTSLVKIPIFYSHSYSIKGNGASMVDLHPSLDWMEQQSTNKNFSVLADLNLYGKYLSLSIEDGYQPAFVAFDERKYEIVVGGSSDVSSVAFPDYIAVDKKSTQPVIGFIWNIFEPLGKFSEEIKKNDLLTIVYEDQSVIIARFDDAIKTK
jgi:hypothetical protein